MATNKEILLVVDVVSNEKEIDKEVIFQALESALAAATAKRHEHKINARVAIDRETGFYDTFRRWEVVEADEEFENGLQFPDAEILLADAREENADIEIGDFKEEPIDSVDFGRIAAQTAKQVIIQKVREL